MIIEAGTNEARAVQSVTIDGVVTKHCVRVDVERGCAEVVIVDPNTNQLMLCDGGSAWQTKYVFGIIEVTLKPGWFFNDKKEMVYLGEQPPKDENESA